MKTSHSFVVGLGFGALCTLIIYFLFVRPQMGGEHSHDQGGADEPLYWVAPMDPNFRRDGPGLSPMGMDLVPVYASDNDSDSPGTIYIDPNVINNLGVKTAPAQTMSLQVPINTLAYVQYSEDTLVHIHPRVEGWVDTLYVKASGDYVKQGEPLYSLYSPELVNAQEEYLLAIGRGNRNLISASTSRLKALQMPQSAIDALDKTKQVQQTIQFNAPQTGFVENLNIREGFFVKPGTTMMSIGALDEVWVEAQVFERQAPLVKSGLPVRLQLDYLPGQSWQGEVEYVYPSVNEDNRTVSVRARFDNPDYLLKPNMFANLTIYSEDDTSRLVVPNEAVIRTGRQNRVVLDKGEGKFKSIEVELGLITPQGIEILSGLEQGDSVVTSAQFLLDSESSISSDFKRMEVAEAGADADDEQDNEPVWVAAEIVELMAQERMVRMQHEAIAEWEMMAMTMNFSVADDIDIEQLQAGTELHAQIVKTPSGPYQIIGVHIMGSDAHDMHGDH
jgi:Cu(I)/Ag(I) efflux system membrane fusion protein